MRYRIKFAKDGLAVYISHLDLMRTWERALRRAGVRLAFSAGFNPHPKMSFAQALALGVDSCAEYLDLELVHEIDCAREKELLNQVLPSGIRVLQLAALADDEEPAMAQVTAAAYIFRGRSEQDLSAWQKGIDALLQRQEVVIVRDGKKGLRELNIAEFILDLAVEKESDEVKLSLLASAGSRGNLRPQEVLQALEKYAGLILADYQLVRTGLYCSKGKAYQPLISGEVE